MSKQPLVSILINNYNYGQFVSTAIDSALQQTYPHIEVIVVDDGSLDNSQEKITAYGDKIIPIFKENGGQASAFNAGFAASRGEIICLLDADDLFTANKVAAVVEVMHYNHELGWCFHPLTLVNTTCQELDIEATKLGTSKEYDLRPHIHKGKLNDYLPSFGVPATSGLCFRRSLLEKILPMPEAKTVSLSDNYIKYLALALSKGFALHQPLALQRIHDSNAYTQRSDQQKQQMTARIAILTAYWLRVKLPSIYKFTNNTFAWGLKNYWQTGGVEAEYKNMVRQYISTTTWREQLTIYSKSLYYYLR